MRQIEVIPAVPARRKYRRPAGLVVVAVLVAVGAAAPAGAAGRAYSAPSCSLAARLTVEGVVFDYSPPASSSVPRWFGLYSAAGVLLGQATLEPGSSSAPIKAERDADVRYANTWLRLVDQLACSGVAPTPTTVPEVAVTVPVPPTVPAAVPETTTSTVPATVEIGVPVGPVTSAPAEVVEVEVLASSLPLRALPATGSTSARYVLLAVVLLVGGAWMVLAARRL